MSNLPYQINDPVHIAGETRPLEGIVTYIGPRHHTEESTSSTTTDASSVVVGIRLTGSSVGLGSHDGTVGGYEYFQCPPQCGLLVSPDRVTVRSLTKLEELKLKRELASFQRSSTPSTSASGSTTTTTTTTTTATSSTSATNASTTAAMTTPLSSRLRRPMASTTPSAASTESPLHPPQHASGISPPREKLSKLEELKRRREALKERKEEVLAAVHVHSTALPAVSDVTSTTTPATPIASTPATSTTSTTTIATSTTPSTSYIATTTIQEETRSMGPDYEAQLAEQKALVASLSTQLQQAQRHAEQATMEAQEAWSKVRQWESSVPSTPVADKVQRATQDLQDELQQAQLAHRQVQDQLQASQQDLKRVQQHVRDLEQRVQDQGDALAHARADATTWQREWQTLQDASEQRGAADASHYKERAKLQAELSALQRKVTQLTRDLQTSESLVEDLTFDKEQLQEEKDVLSEKLEDAKLDAETAQMELDELQAELAELKAVHEAAVSAAPSSSSKSVTTDSSATVAAANAEAEDRVQAVNIQNTRLREALIRLREQTLVEKLDWQRQLRTAEKQAEQGQAILQETEGLRVLRARLDEEINDLKDMVEQGAAFESMVEDLSDRVLMLEEVNTNLRTTIRELEEASELAAELEEVQADELKALYRDLEGRDTVIHNLEEAIKMQRRREEDFLRTVGNYRTTVDTLRQEKQALLELQQGGEGEKSDLVSSSQKALARAAQLVSDSAATRKREGQAVLDSIERQVYRHLAGRLEALLPTSVVASEVAAIRGEMLTSKVIAKASRSLEGIVVSFGKVIKPGLPVNEESQTIMPTILQRSDDVRREVTTMIHQAEFAHLIIDASSELLRLVAAGQWPDLLTPDSSVELGAFIGNSVIELDNALEVVLRSLKEEGVLTSEQSNIGAFNQSIQSTMQAIRSEIEREKNTLVSADWNPPGWQLLKDASHAKFSCMGASAALSAVLHQPDLTPIPPSLAKLYNKLEQGSSQASHICLRLSTIDVQASDLVKELSEAVKEWKDDSDKMIDSIKDLVMSHGDMNICEMAIETTLKSQAKLSSELRVANLYQHEAETHHALSPEVVDPWYHIATLARSIRAVDGDNEDVNFMMRARAIETQLHEAVDNVPKLSMANNKLSSLEKVRTVNCLIVAFLLSLSNTAIYRAF
jgi:dynactin 1